ncbi:281R [Invertebrate iridescent virus Kaz2018]|nr:281R [Invertebrate iridescent virus Kaz2018]
MKPEVTFDEEIDIFVYLLHCQDLNLNTIRLLFLNAFKISCLLIFHASKKIRE